MNDSDAISEVVLDDAAAFPDAYQGRWVRPPDRNDSYVVTIAGRTLTENDQPVRFQSIVTFVHDDGRIAAIELKPFPEDAADDWARRNPYFLLLDPGGSMSVVSGKSEVMMIRDGLSIEGRAG